jgi:hypothetical protein
MAMGPHAHVLPGVIFLRARGVGGSPFFFKSERTVSQPNRHESRRQKGLGVLKISSAHDNGGSVCSGSDVAGASDLGVPSDRWGGGVQVGGAVLGDVEQRPALPTMLAIKVPNQLWRV